MLLMPTFELGDPIPQLISMEADNLTQHELARGFQPKTEAI